MRMRFASLLFLPLGLGIAAAEAASGAADLLVAPTRVVLEGRQRTAEVTLVNTGSTPATYRIGFVQIRMNEDGSTTEIETPGPGERFSDGLIRFSPRQVTLEPNVAQTVRIQLRKPADLPAGEYRSHLRFRGVPRQDPVQAANASSGINVHLVPVYGVSIPVIVRQGETAATVALDAPELGPPGENGVRALSVRMRRTGNQSVIGNFAVSFIPLRGEPIVVGLAGGVAVYTPNPTRVVMIPLHVPPGTPLRNGRLRVSYTRADSVSEKLAEAVLVLP